MGNGSTGGFFFKISISMVGVKVSVVKDFLIYFPAPLALLVFMLVFRYFGPFDNCLTSNVANSSKTHFHRMVLQTHLSAGEAVKISIHPPSNEENLSICVDSH